MLCGYAVDSINNHSARDAGVSKLRMADIGGGSHGATIFSEATRAAPLVDPDYLFVERRAEELHAYARGLLKYLRQIRADGESRGYPIATIKSAAVWLIEMYAMARIAPVPEAAQLMNEIAQPDRDSSTSPVRRSSEEAYWAAIKFEAGQPPEPTGKQPSMATRYAVAKYVRPHLQNKNASQKTAEGTVRGWRRLSHYQDNVKLQRPSALRGIS